jgi:hypothetical protein
VFAIDSPITPLRLPLRDDAVDAISGHLDGIRVLRELSWELFPLGRDLAGAVHLFGGAVLACRWSRCGHRYKALVPSDDLGAPGGELLGAYHAALVQIVKLR